MEDAHIVDLNVDGKGSAVFGVFDGHGGTITIISYHNRR